MPEQADFPDFPALGMLNGGTRAKSGKLGRIKKVSQAAKRNSASGGIVAPTQANIEICFHHPADDFDKEEQQPKQERPSFIKQDTELTLSSVDDDSSAKSGKKFTSHDSRTTVGSTNSWSNVVSLGLAQKESSTSLNTDEGTPTIDVETHLASFHESEHLTVFEKRAIQEHTRLLRQQSSDKEEGDKEDETTESLCRSASSRNVDYASIIGKTRFEEVKSAIASGAQAPKKNADDSRKSSSKASNFHLPNITEDEEPKPTVIMAPESVASCDEPSIETPVKTFVSVVSAKKTTPVKTFASAVSGKQASNDVVAKPVASVVSAEESSKDIPDEIPDETPAKTIASVSTDENKATPPRKSWAAIASGKQPSSTVPAKTVEPVISEEEQPSSTTVVKAVESVISEEESSNDVPVEAVEEKSNTVAEKSVEPVAPEEEEVPSKETETSSKSVEPAVPEESSNGIPPVKTFASVAAASGDKPVKSYASVASGVKPSGSTIPNNKSSTIPNNKKVVKKAMTTELPALPPVLPAFSGQVKGSKWGRADSTSLAAALNLESGNMKSEILDARPPGVKKQIKKQLTKQSTASFTVPKEDKPIESPKVEDVPDEISKSVAKVDEDTPKVTVKIDDSEKEKSKTNGHKPKVTRTQSSGSFKRYDSKGKIKHSDTSKSLDPTPKPAELTASNIKKHEEEIAQSSTSQNFEDDARVVSCPDQEVTAEQEAAAPVEEEETKSDPGQHIEEEEDNQVTRAFHRADTLSDDDIWGSPLPQNVERQQSPSGVNNNTPPSGVNNNTPPSGVNNNTPTANQMNQPNQTNQAMINMAYVNQMNQAVVMTPNSMTPNAMTPNANMFSMTPTHNAIMVDGNGNQTQTYVDANGNVFMPVFMPAQQMASPQFSPVPSCQISPVPSQQNLHQQIQQIQHNMMERQQQQPQQQQQTRQYNRNPIGKNHTTVKSPPGNVQGGISGLSRENSAISDTCAAPAMQVHVVPPTGTVQENLQVPVQNGNVGMTNGHQQQQQQQQGFDPYNFPYAYCRPSNLASQSTSDVAGYRIRGSGQGAGPGPGRPPHFGIPPGVDINQIPIQYVDQQHYMTGHGFNQTPAQGAQGNQSKGNKAFPWQQGASQSPNFSQQGQVGVQGKGGQKGWSPQKNQSPYGSNSHRHGQESKESPQSGRKGQGKGRYRSLPVVSVHDTSRRDSSVDDGILSSPSRGASPCASVKGSCKGSEKGGSTVLMKDITIKIPQFGSTTARCRDSLSPCSARSARSDRSFTRQGRSPRSEKVVGGLFKSTSRSSVYSRDGSERSVPSFGRAPSSPSPFGRQLASPAQRQTSVSSFKQSYNNDSSPDLRSLEEECEDITFLGSRTLTPKNHTPIGDMVKSWSLENFEALLEQEDIVLDTTIIQNVDSLEELYAAVKDSDDMRRATFADVRRLVLEALELPKERLSEIEQGVQVETIGSMACGTSLPDSDLDLVVLLPPQVLKIGQWSRADVADRLMKILIKNGYVPYDDQQPMFSGSGAARQPVRIKLKGQWFDIDINLGFLGTARDFQSGLRSTQFLQNFFSRHPMGLIFQILILLWKKHLRENDVRLPSHILNVMIYYFATSATSNMANLKAPRRKNSVSKQSMLFCAVMKKFIDFYSSADPSDEYFWTDVAQCGETISGSVPPHIFGHQQQLREMKECLKTFSKHNIHGGSSTASEPGNV